MYRTNQKIDTEKQKVNWLTMRWMQYRNAFSFKETLEEDISFWKVNLAHTFRPGTIPKQLQLLRDGSIMFKVIKN